MKRFIFLIAAVCISSFTMAQNNNKAAQPKGPVNTNGSGEVLGDILDGVGIKTNNPKEKAKVVNKVKTTRSGSRRRKG